MDNNDCQGSKHRRPMKYAMPLCTVGNMTNYLCIIYAKKQLKLLCNGGKVFMLFF